MRSKSLARAWLRAIAASRSLAALACSPSAAMVTSGFGYRSTLGRDLSFSNGVMVSCYR